MKLTSTKIASVICTGGVMHQSIKQLVIIFATIAIGLPSAVTAQNATKTLIPIISLLLDATPIEFPVSWNNKRVNENDELSANEGSTNLVSIDYRRLPSSFTDAPEQISFDVSGACYQLFSGSTDQRLFEYNVVATGPGICQLSMQIDGSDQVISHTLDVNIAAQPLANNINKILAGADTSTGEAIVEGQFNFTNIRQWSPSNNISGHPGAVFSDSNTPNMFEFGATYNGVPLNGVMLTTARKLVARNFSNLQIDSRTHVRFVEGQPALIGSGKVVGSAGNTNTFAFIATGINVTLPGPAQGREFHAGGKNKLNALCVEERIVGFSQFDNERTLSRISTSLVGFTDKDCTSNNNRFVGTTGVFADFQSVDTHIGSILRGRGTAHPLNNGRINTVADQDDNDPDYALYFLGLAERLSDAHEILPLDSDSVLDSKVYVFDPFAIAKIAKIRRENGTMVFREPPEILTGISVGDIIVGKPSARLRDGFFREVTAKGQQNGLFFLQTKPAKLDQLFEQGGFEINSKALNFEDLDEIITPEYYGDDVTQSLPSSVQFGFEKTRASFQALKQQQMSRAQEQDDSESTIQRKGFLNLPLPNVSFDHVFVDLDNNFSTTNDQWRTEGRFELGASVTVKFKCGFLCTKPYFLLKFDFTEDFELSGHVYTDVLEAISEKHTITSMKFGRIWLGPVSIRPQIDLNVILSGETDTDVEFGVDQFFTAELGVELEDGDWNTINNQSFGISASPTPDYQPNDGEANVQARAALEGSVKLSGIRVGGVDAGIYTDLDAATPRDPLWEVTAGLNSEAYVEIDLLVTTINGGPFELFDIPFNIEGGEAPDFPVEIKSIKVDGIEIENGVAVRSEDTSNPDFTVPQNTFSASENFPLSIKVQAFDPEIGYDCCTVKLTDLTENTVIGTKEPGDVSNRNNYKFQISELSNGTHTMEVRALEIGKHSSFAIVETFTLSAIDLNEILNDCKDIELAIGGNGEDGVNETINPSELTFLRATLSNGCLGNSGHEVSFFENPPGATSVTPYLVVNSTESNGDIVAVGSLYSDLDDFGSREVVAKYTDRRGDVITSNPVVIKVESLVADIIGGIGDGSNIDPSPTNTSFTACNGGGCPMFSFKVSGFEPQQTQNSAATTMAPTTTPSNTEPHRLRLDNWAVGETSYFDNPFGALPDYSVSWAIDDDSATIVNQANGNGEITPSQAGWHRVTARYTHDTEPGLRQRFIKHQIFFISPNTNLKWRGYEQETIDDDATRLEMMTGMIGNSPI